MLYIEYTSTRYILVCRYGLLNTDSSDSKKKSVKEMKGVRGSVRCDPNKEFREYRGPDMHSVYPHQTSVHSLASPIPC